jgi:hypothetical protein
MGIIKISVKGLALFMTSADSRRRKILHDYKHPDPEGKAQAGYHREARNSIKVFNRAQHPADWLSKRSIGLLSQAGVSKERIAQRLRDNAKVLQQYEKAWGDVYFSLIDDITLDLSYKNVRISIHPDLHIVDNGVERIIRLE